MKRKIKVSHEVPFCLLNYSREFNDYDYCLPHLLDQNEEYKAYFIQAKAEGRYIVMDNSLHELGTAYDNKCLMYWINVLEPNEFMVPDVWENKVASIVNARAWSKYELPEGVTKVAVVQAKSIEEAAECYTKYKILGYRKIAFSYGANYYQEHFYIIDNIGDLINYYSSGNYMSDNNVALTFDIYNNTFIKKFIYDNKLKKIVTIDKFIIYNSMYSPKVNYKYNDIIKLIDVLIKNDYVFDLEYYLY